MTNFLMSMSSFIGYAIGVFILVSIAAHLYKKYGSDVNYISHHQNHRRMLIVRNWASMIILILGLYISALSPSNTPKNVGFDRAAAQKQQMYEDSIAPEPTQTIEDRSIKPRKSTEEREKSFKEMVSYGE